MTISICITAQEAMESCTNFETVNKCMGSGSKLGSKHFPYDQGSKHLPLLPRMKYLRDVGFLWSIELNNLQ